MVFSWSSSATDYHILPRTGLNARKLKKWDGHLIWDGLDGVGSLNAPLLWAPLCGANNNNHVNALKLSFSQVWLHPRLDWVGPPDCLRGCHIRPKCKQQIFYMMIWHHMIYHMISLICFWEIICIIICKPQIFNMMICFGESLASSIQWEGNQTKRPRIWEVNSCQNNGLQILVCTAVKGSFLQLNLLASTFSPDGPLSSK